MHEFDRPGAWMTTQAEVYILRGLSGNENNLNMKYLHLKYLKLYYFQVWGGVSSKAIQIHVNQNSGIKLIKTLSERPFKYKSRAGKLALIEP